MRRGAGGRHSRKRRGRDEHLLGTRSSGEGHQIVRSGCLGALESRHRVQYKRASQSTTQQKLLTLSGFWLSTGE